MEITPPITIVRWNLEAMGREAVSLLLDRITDQTTGKTRDPRHVMVPTEIVLRRSCKLLK